MCKFENRNVKGMGKVNGAKCVAVSGDMKLTRVRKKEHPFAGENEYFEKQVSTSFTHDRPSLSSSRLLSSSVNTKNSQQMEIPRSSTIVPAV